YYPDAMSAESYDKSFKIAAPGRVLADEVKLNAADPEGWHDLKGNLVEAVLTPAGTFEYRGYGIGWASLRYHAVQATTPRHKSASFGARCMRFKP
ncbi:MAG TPA: hypothetical protein VLT33_44075, partial [Labilithrix sp.]|nr:hypothetical protein [Labilithrix sp.]